VKIKIVLQLDPPEYGTKIPTHVIMADDKVIAAAWDEDTARFIGNALANQP